MNELDIAVASHEELSLRFSSKWDDISVEELTCLLRLRPDYVKIMYEGSVDLDVKAYYIPSSRERKMLQRAARNAGMTVRFDEGHVLRGVKWTKGVAR